MSKERKERVEAAKIAMEAKELSLRVAEERFGVPRSTIHDHVSCKYFRIGAGRLPILTKEKEKSIVRSCEVLAQSGFGLDRFMVGTVVHDYLESQERVTPFKDGVPGKKW